MQCIPERHENLEGHKNIKLHLDGDLYVITSDIQGLMYVGFHKFVGQEIIQSFNLAMDEWTKFLTAMESITEEVNESQPNTLHYTLHELIHLSYIYISKGSQQLLWVSKRSSRSSRSHGIWLSE